jgi:hypothetical protein
VGGGRHATLRVGLLAGAGVATIGFFYGSQDVMAKGRAVRSPLLY